MFKGIFSDERENDRRGSVLETSNLFEKVKQDILKTMSLASTLHNTGRDVYNL
jgi:hypothetical protein